MNQIQPSQLSQLLVPAGLARGSREASAQSGAMRVDERRPEFVSGLPLQESESVQLEPGDAAYVSRRVLGREVVLMAYNVAPELRVHSVPHEDWLILFMATNPRAAFVINGREARTW